MFLTPIERNFRLPASIFLFCYTNRRKVHWTVTGIWRDQCSTGLCLL